MAGRETAKHYACSVPTPGCRALSSRGGVDSDPVRRWVRLAANREPSL